MTVGREANGEVLDGLKGVRPEEILRVSRSMSGYGRGQPMKVPGRVLLGKLLKDGVEPTPQLVQNLLYKGRIHSIAGAPGDGKTLLALRMALQVVDRGFSALYYDAENGPWVVAERLGAMGADPDALDRFFYYLPGDLTLAPDSLSTLMARVAAVQPALVVFDSLADFLAAAGLDENSNTDCTRWFAAVAQPLKDAGVAILVLDHVPKSGKGGPRGASSKVAKMDVQWELEVNKRFSRDRTGKIKLTCNKDRESWLPKTVMFSFGGGVFARSTDKGEKPDSETGLSENGQKIYDAMRKAGKEGARWSDLEHAVGGSKGNVTRGRDELEGYGLLEKRDRRYFLKEAVPEKSVDEGNPKGTVAYRNGTAVPDGTRVPEGVPTGTTPSRGGTAGTTDAETLGRTHTEEAGTERVPRERGD